LTTSAAQARVVLKITRKRSNSTDPAKAKNVCGGTLHCITLQTIYSGLSKNNFEDHYGDAATE